MKNINTRLNLLVPVVGMIALSACARPVTPTTDMTTRGTDGITQTGTAGMQGGTGTIAGSGTTTDSRGGSGDGAFIIDNGVRGSGSTANGGNGASGQGGMAGHDMRMRSDAEVVDIVQTSNMGEIQTGQLGVQRATDTRVRQFAQRMIDEHTAANQRLAGTGVTATTRDAMSTNMLQSTEQALVSLRAQSGFGFDRAYMDNQVQMHTFVLHNLDNVLIPSAKNAELRTVLQTMRTAVADHLRQAQELRRDIGGQ